MASTEHLKPFLFKKGQSGNPSGRRPLPAHLRAVIPVSHEEINRLISLYGRMTYGELSSAIEKGNLPAFDMSIAKIFCKAIEDADYSAFNFLLDRAVGKAPTFVVEDDNLQTMSITELLTLLAKQVPEAAAHINVKDEQCA